MARNSSRGNDFPSEDVGSTQQRNETEETPSRLPIHRRTRYENLLLQYDLSEKERRSHAISKILWLASQRKNLPLLLKLPMRKMLEFFSRMFMMDVLELVVLQCHLNEVSWERVSKFLLEHCRRIGERVDVGKDSPLDISQFHTLSLLLVLLCYSVKKESRESAYLQLITQEVVNRFPLANFREFHESWSRLYGANISLKSINVWSKEMDKPLQISYSDMVDKIIDIAPAYQQERKKAGDNSVEESNQEHHFKDVPEESVEPASTRKKPPQKTRKGGKQ